MDRPLVMFVRLEPVIVAGLRAAWRQELIVVEKSEQHGAKLADEARRTGVSAVVVRLQEMPDIVDALPPSVLVVALSATSHEASVSHAGDIVTLANPSPEDVADLIRNAG